MCCCEELPPLNGRPDHRVRVVAAAPTSPEEHRRCDLRLADDQRTAHSAEVARQELLTSMPPGGSGPRNPRKTAFKGPVNH